MLIREVTRRTGRGWPTILLLSAALGLVEAGLIDQSLFNPHVVDEPSWPREGAATLLPVLGISAGPPLTFLAGHVIWSFAAPIAVVEACTPRCATRPWLGRIGIGIGIVAVLYGRRGRPRCSPGRCCWCTSCVRRPGRVCSRTCWRRHCSAD
ncbi:hypothetical protein ACFZAR_02400 [Streptomyces sp. NPDC008222]|uniref:hypothetical protein n=1 Tax=Streptomyces sp. NPDC008222 TaxID=3364820 RepID=UPI0036EFDC75